MSLLTILNRAHTPVEEYVCTYVEGAESGKRLNSYGRRFADNTLPALRRTKELFLEFQMTRPSRILFIQVDKVAMNKFKAFLQQKGYSTNTVDKYLTCLKTIISRAEEEGYKPRSSFRLASSIREDVESIYLTQEEVEKLMNVDLSDMPQCYSYARDIFLIGVWTAQRVSDYGSISPQSIHYDRGLVTLDILQKKTGQTVSIPCNPHLLAVLQRYDMKPPHIAPQHLNKYIKVIGKMAGIDQIVEIEKSTLLGRRRMAVPKYTLITSHTARRTGATLMYLSGMEYWDIMMITGHSSPEMLKRYIKANSLDVAKKLAQKYDYFN